MGGGGIERGSGVERQSTGEGAKEYRKLTYLYSYSHSAINDLYCSIYMQYLLTLDRKSKKISTKAADTVYRLQITIDCFYFL
jgi:hypothetical protein